MNSADTTLTTCCVCSKEIPLAAALSAEGAEYVGHFCKARAEGEATATTPSAEGGKADQVEAPRQS